MACSAPAHAEDRATPAKDVLAPQLTALFEVALKMEDEKGPLCGETTLLFMDMTMMLCNGSVLPPPSTR